MSRPEQTRNPMRKAPKRASQPQVQGRIRKPYRAPRLKVYGRLADLTRFGGSQVVDSGSGLGNQP